MMVDETLDERLQNITMADTMPAVVFELVQAAIARGRVTELVLGAAAARPGNAALRTVASRFTLAAAEPAELERIVVRSAQFQNAAQWLDRLARLRSAICRCEPQPQSKDGYGTGFLVAPDLVMTNFHVAQLLTGPAARIRFDFELSPGGHEQPGLEVKVAADGLVAMSPVNELDYALVRLDRRVTDGHPREVISPSAHSFSENEPLVILQHPVAEPLKLAFGVVVKPVDGDGVTYTVNTEGGSSGSPCMTSDLRTVALHRQGLERTNKGVRMDAILRHLETTGRRQLLG